MNDIYEERNNLDKKIEDAKLIAAHAPELNMNNYNFEEVERLNNATIDIHNILFKE